MNWLRIIYDCRVQIEASLKRVYEEVLTLQHHGNATSSDQVEEAMRNWLQARIDTAEAALRLPSPPVN